MTVIKKRNLGRMVALAAVLCLITTCMLGGTLAKYVTSAETTGTATVAEWSFDVTGTDGSALATVALNDTTDLGDNLIAPGASGSFGVRVNANGSEVGVNYTVELTDIMNKPTNLKFYTDANHSQEINLIDSKYTVTGEIELANVGTPVDVPIYWNWAYETTGGDSTDTSDQNKDMTFKVVVTGTQMEPTTNP